MSTNSTVTLWACLICGQINLSTGHHWIAAVWVSLAAAVLLIECIRS